MSFRVNGGHELKGVVEEFLNYLDAPKTNHGKGLSSSLMLQIEEYGDLMVKAAIDRFGTEKSWQNRAGCYICVADYDSGFPGLVFRVGNPVPEKLFRYWFFSQEKALRTAFYKHTTSFESADDDLMHYGGAVRVPRQIIAPSGFPAHGDEAIALGMHVLIGNIAIKQARSIAAKSGNPYFDVLVKDIEESMGL
ncbi:MAG: hypothetical protein Q7S84_04420 [bacterium]|nr:hypothetical protein [bacterium]